MPLKVKCDCGTVLTVPAQRIGKSVRCPSCRETVLIQPPKKEQQPQKPQPSKPKPPAKKGSTPTSTAASKSDERWQTKPVKPKPSKTTLADSKGEDKAIADSARQDHKDPVEPAKKTGGSQPTEAVDESKPSSTDAKKPKETEPQKETKREVGEDQSAKAVPSESHEDAQTTDELSKPAAKSSEAIVDKTATPEKVSKEETKPKNEAVEEDPTPSRSARADANKERRKPVPSNHKEDSKEGKKPKENKPATTAKKLPPALKRASSTEKGKVKESSQTQSRSEKTTVSDDKSKRPAAKVEKEKKPPPLKPTRSPEGTKPAAKVTSAGEKWATVPPLPKPKSKPRADSKDRPKKDSPKWTSRLKRIKRSSAKSSEAADEQTVRRGIQHDPAKRWSAYYLAIGVIVVALFNMAPAFYEGFQAFRLDPPRPMARWAYAAVIVGLLQLAYAFYLIQLPDWGSVWVVAILSLAATTMYAALASAVVFGGQDSNLLESLQLNYVARKKAMLWCTIMLTLSAVLTYFGGRLAIRWHKAFSIAYPTTPSPSSN